MKQARSIETSGFLGNLYPVMQKGSNGEALWIDGYVMMCLSHSLALIVVFETL